MPIYRNDSPEIRMVPSIEGSVPVFPGDSVRTTQVPSAPLALGAPGKLREVQVWDRLVGKDEIDGVPQ